MRSEDEIRELMRHTDTVAEIQNTLRTVTGSDPRRDRSDYGEDVT